jgi:hypothetical protein
MQWMDLLIAYSRITACPIPEIADTVFGTPEDGHCDARNM